MRTVIYRLGLRRTLERLQRFVVDSNHRHAKFAARLLSYTKHRSEICAEMVEVRVSLLCSIRYADPHRPLWRSFIMPIQTD